MKSTLSKGLAMAMVIAASLVWLPSSLAAGFKDDCAPGVMDGAGIWVNMWNYPAPAEADNYCRTLKEHGISNLFVQTSRSTTPAISSPEALGTLIETCHKNGIRVIAWSFAELLDPELDAQKMVLAARFTTPAGDHIDGIAPNMEKNLESWRIEKYSKSIREKLGPNYPMMAVVYSPLNKCFEVARINWQLLARYYDCIAPMVYWNSKYQKIEPYSYTVETIQKIRQLTRRPDIEIHCIGDGMGTSGESIHQFLKACRTAEATGASLYPNQRATADQMKTISRYPDYLPANGRFRLAAFREFMNAGLLPEPPVKDPAREVARRDFYKLVVSHLHPALSAGHEAKARHVHLRRLPSPVECKEAGPVEAYGILVGLGLVADMTDTCSIENILDSPVYSDEAISLLARVVDLDHKRRTIEHGAKGKLRMDRWLVPPAQAEVVPARAGTSRPLNYLDVSQMVLQTSSALH